MNTDLAVKAKFFKGLSDSTRLAILLCLVDQEKTVGEIVELTDSTQSNISNHLKCLAGCGLVKNRRDGKNIFYSLRDEKTKELLSVSDSVIKKVYSDIEACLEIDKFTI
jgi:ArsR family transcriptional regulator